MMGFQHNPGSAQAAANARWSKPRPARADKRVRTLPAGSKIEERYIARAEELGLILEDHSLNARRRIAKRLADDDTARKMRRIHEAKPSTISDDDDLLIAYYTAEAARWRARVKRDRQIALAHELMADQAESELADLLFKLGVVS